MQSSNVLSDFDFDSFLQDGDDQPFDFNEFFNMDGGNIGAD